MCYLCIINFFSIFPKMFCFSSKDRFGVVFFTNDQLKVVWFTDEGHLPANQNGFTGGDFTLL